MKHFFILILLNSFSLWSQNNLASEIYKKKFPIEKMILGEWFLEKIEIVELNKNDSSSIVSVESGKDKIVFNEDTYKIIPDTIGERFYRPTHEFFYKIEKEKYSNDEIVVTDKKGKKSFDQFSILLCSFDKLVIENYEFNLRLGDQYSIFQYTYRRKSHGNQSLVGKWVANEAFHMFSENKRDSIWYTFHLLSDYSQDSLSALNLRTEVEFKKDLSYTKLTVNYSVGLYHQGKYIVDSAKKKLYFISNEIIECDYSFDGNGNLIIRRSFDY